MKSMTGYGYAEGNDGRFSASIELKTYNNRYLDLIFSLPPVLGPLEERLRETLRQKIARGRIELFLRFKDLQEQLSISLDQANIESYAEVLRTLSRLAGLPDALRLEHLLAMDGLVRVDRNRDIEACWSFLLPLLQAALLELEASRLREGSAIRADLLAQLCIIEGLASSMEKHVPQIELTVRDQLRQRFVGLMGDLVDEQRMLAEVAVQLNRLTVHEELVRLAAHCGAARQFIQEGKQAGKKLDFLFQEMNREINTIGSKSSLVGLSNDVVSAKEALENLREQVRNVE